VFSPFRRAPQAHGIGRFCGSEGLLLENWRWFKDRGVAGQLDNTVPLQASAQRPLGHQPDVDVERVDELLLPGKRGWNELRMRDYLA
jgi:hypothetical protein